MIMSVIDILFLLLISAAAYTDIRERRVPNMICILTVLPVIFRALCGGTSGRIPVLTDIFAGGIAAFLIMIIPYAVNRSLGAGDVKLMSVCGLYLGLRGSITVIFAAFTLCAVSALVIMAVKRRKISSLPFAPFIFAGTVYFLLSAYLA